MSDQKNESLAMDVEPHTRGCDPSRKVSEEAAAKRRGRPPLSYTEDFDTPGSVQMDVIGVVRSPYKV